MKSHGTQDNTSTNSILATCWHYYILGNFYALQTFRNFALGFETVGEKRG
jgi:hypothetical protein